MRQCLHFLVFALWLGLTHYANGAQLQISQTRLTELIVQPAITSIFRSRAGYLWVGTQDGLYRFDGSSSTTFGPDEKARNWIPSSYISSIGEDTDGNLFVATYRGGVLKWDQKKSKFLSINANASFDQSRIAHMLVGKSGVIWLATDEKLILYFPKLDSISAWMDEQDIVAKIGNPYSLLEDGDGRLFVGGSSGLAMISPDDKLVTVIDLSKLRLPNTTKITALKLNHTGKMVIGTDTGHLTLLDLGSMHVLAQTKLSKDGPIFVSSLALQDGRLIIGTDKGLYLSDTDLSFVKDISSVGMGLSHSDIYTISLDSGYFWIGTLNGLDLLSFSSFELFNFEGRGNIDVMAFEEDIKGGIWVATYSGLFSYDESIGSHKLFAEDSGAAALEDQRVTAIASKGDELWVGFYRSGVQKINSRTGDSTAVTLTDSGDLAITRIEADPQSNDVWIATYNHGLFRVNEREIVAYIENNSLPEKTITSILLSETGIMLAVSDSSIYQYNSHTDSFTPINFDFNLGSKNPSVYALYQTTNKDILIGTKDHGLFVWTRDDQSGNQLKLRGTAEGSTFATSSIYAIQQDSSGNIWCSTERGIVKLDSNGQLIKRFTTSDGIQNNDFLVGASFSDKKGQIYFGGLSGYSRFNPDEVEIDNSPSQMVFTGINFPGYDLENTGPISNLKSLQLTHKDRFVTFQFSVLDLIHPEKNQFRYMLENFDPDWIDNGARNTATYTNLPAGEYVFRVQGANSSGIWNLEGLSLNVRMLPPLWKTWWAYSFYALAALFLAWNFRRIFNSYAIERRSTELATEMFEAENQADDDMQEQLELQDELVQSAYTHNMETLSLVSNCVSQRTGSLADDSIDDYALGNIRRIEALACLEDCLYYQVGGPVANLQKYADSIISKLLTNAPVNPESIITINEIPSKLVPAELASPLAIVLFELLENCVQHAFEEDSPANYIHITMESKASDKPPGREFELCVRDSGGGIKGSIEDLSNEHTGIAIVQSIVNKLGGTIQLVTSTGTSITVTIPDPGT